MLEATPISPMLDHFAMGGAISEHHGVKCYPAMENDTNGKYIVKVISIPASHSQLEALLLSGAYSSKEAALGYYREMAESTIQETEVLNKLSQMEGFLPVRDAQLVTVDGMTGFEVYMLTAYQRTLAKQYTHHPLTHLQAVNLGLDLCAALAVCRRSGYLYVDLKPNNVYITETGSYKIGDLGFISLESLKYSSLPDRYRSQYTPPEISDAFSSLNTTADVYALGLILYQVYNNGTLPFDSDDAPCEAFPAPAYADYEMAEIILKACAPNPEDRWQTPLEMGQALVAYMQRNGANDTPIIPSPNAEEKGENISSTAEDASDSEQDGAGTAEHDAVLDPGTSHIEDTPTEEDSEKIGKNPDSEELQDNNSSASEVQKEKETEETEQIAASVNPEVDAIIEDTRQILGEQDTENSEHPLEVDETTPEQSQLEVPYEEVTDEVNDMLTQADELVSHPVPEPAVAPDPIEVPIPDPIEPDNQDMDPEKSEESIPECDIEYEELQEESDLNEEQEVQDIADSQPVKHRKHWVRNTAVVLIAAGVITAGVFFYKDYYLVPVNGIQVSGSKDTLTVQVDSSADDSILSVVCSDAYGTKLSAPVIDGSAFFDGLVPDTGYTIYVEANGFHKTSGNVNATYSTPVKTSIVQFNAVTGSENGSAILSFTVEGPDSQEWQVSYSSEGEEEKTVTFDSHTVTLTGLTIGKEYTFTLAPVGDLYVAGETEIKHTASDLIYAENLEITACENNSLTAQWSAPEGVDVGSWTVRCYNTEIYNETIVVSEPTAVFQNLDPTKGYTIEVTASGMSVSQRTYVSENPIVFQNSNVELDENNDLVITWETDAPMPEGGWVINYTVNDNANTQTITTQENKVVISPTIPGARYTFSLANTEETTVLGLPKMYQLPEVPAFACTYEDFTVTADDMDFHLIKRPRKHHWNKYHVRESDYTDTFASGRKTAFLIKLNKEYGVSEDDIQILYLIQKEDGTAYSADTVTQKWIDMWYRGYSCLDVPTMPRESGNYMISVYFNGAFATQKTFTIVE